MASPSPLRNASHRRLNPLTGEWVLVSPHRTQRPWQGRRELKAATPALAHDPDCYLCPGNLRANGVRNPDYPHTFVFDNDFPALKADAPTTREVDGLLVAEGETGLCRVLCFSPRHDLTLAGMAVADIERVVDVWVEETIALGGLPDIASVQIFENRGEMMGASNPHPHGQIWATRHLPNELEKETDRQADYLVQHGRPLLVDYLDRELELGERVVFANDDFCVLVPFWAIWPFETMILPRRRIGGFDELRTRGKDLARGGALAIDPALRQAVRHAVPLFDGLPPEADRRRPARRVADARPFLPAAPAFGDDQEVHGRLRDAGLPAARPHPRGGGGTAARGGGLNSPRSSGRDDGAHVSAEGAIEAWTSSNRSRIVGDGGVGRYERQSFDHGLSDQHAIERVLVNRRQDRQRRRMCAGHRQLGIAIVEKAPAKQCPHRRESRRGPRPVLIAISQRLMALKRSSCSGSPMRDWPPESLRLVRNAQRRIWVSSSSFIRRRRTAFDLFLVHCVEIVRHGELARMKPNRRGLRRVDRHDLDHRLAGLGDDERLAFRRGVDQLGEVGLGVVDVDGFHRLSSD